MRVAAIQMTSGPDIHENLNALEKVICEAVQGGAQLIVTPENTCHIRGRMVEKLETAPEAQTHPIIDRVRILSEEYKVSILLGSLSIPDGRDKLFNRSYLFRAGQSDPVTYDKIHLFDADLGEGQVYRESDVFRGGDRAVLAKIGDMNIGLTICYDLRFPYLYRRLARAGAHIMTVPSAFTVPTGMAHWHTLLRARAIENGCYILAPAQVGVHAGTRETYGHSLIVGPWGDILAEADGKNAQIIYADIDIQHVTEARKRIPPLLNEKQDLEIAYYE